MDLERPIKEIGTDLAARMPRPRARLDRAGRAADDRAADEGPGAARGAVPLRRRAPGVRHAGGPHPPPARVAGGRASPRPPGARRASPAARSPSRRSPRSPAPASSAWRSASSSGRTRKDALPEITKLWRERRRDDRRPARRGHGLRGRGRPLHAALRGRRCARSPRPPPSPARSTCPSRSPRSRRCCARGARARDRGRPPAPASTCCASPRTSARTCTSTWSPSTRARRSPTLTLDLLSEPEFADGPSAGIVLQAYLVESPEHLDHLLDWAASTPRAHPFVIRLVKGAYWDHEVVQAAQHGWAPPVFTDRRECDRNFEPLTRRLIDATPTVRVAIASHNLRSISHAAAYADARGVGNDASSSRSCAGWATTRRPRSPPPAAASARTARSATSSPAWPTSCAACSRTPPTTPSSPRTPAAPTPPSSSRPRDEHLPQRAAARAAPRAPSATRRSHALAALDAKLPLEVPMLIGEDVVHGQVVRVRRPEQPDDRSSPTRTRPPRAHVADAITAAERGQKRLVPAPRRPSAPPRSPAPPASCAPPPRARRARRPRGRQAVGGGRRRRRRGDRLPRVLRRRARSRSTAAAR